jgi:hypothetical protein
MPLGVSQNKYQATQSNYAWYNVTFRLSDGALKTVFACTALRMGRKSALLVLSE